MPAPASKPKPDLETFETRERILRFAEAQFAEHGVNGVSLRTIMGAAGVNTAAIHYHFGSRKALLRAIFEMRVKPMNDERMVLLDRCEAEAGEAPPTVRAVLEAFIGPAIRASRATEGEAFNKLSAICSVDPDPDVRQVVLDAYDEVARRFMKLLRRACHHLSDSEYFWRVHCVYGSMMYVRADNGRVPYLLKRAGKRDANDVVLEQLVKFTAAGLEAP